MYSLRITDKGMREPHWHPETAEMGYIHSGNARMTVLNPDGSTDTYLLKPGDMYFIPPAYPHHIEQLGDETIHFLIFFDQPSPQDIGYRPQQLHFLVLCWRQHSVPTRKSFRSLHSHQLIL